MHDLFFCKFKVSMITEQENVTNHPKRVMNPKVTVDTVFFPDYAGVSEKINALDCDVFFLFYRR